jgi:large subunit ribosomal protein L22
MPGTKTNETEGTRAVLRYGRLSPYKAREVLDLIRGQDVERAQEILRFSQRDAARVVGKVLASAVANAEHNDSLSAEDLYVSSCFADEAMTLKRWRPRARGRATRVRKRSSHITIVLSRLPEERLARARSRSAARATEARARRVAGARRAAAVATRAQAEQEAGARAEPGQEAGEADLEEAAGAGAEEVGLEDVEAQAEEDEAAEAPVEEAGGAASPAAEEDRAGEEAEDEEEAEEEAEDEEEEE